VKARWKASPRREQLLVGVAAIVDQGVGGDGAHGRAPLEPGFEEVGDSLAGGAAVLAGADLANQAGFELAGLGLGRGGAGLLALLAGERVTAGVDDDPPAVAALLDQLKAPWSPASGSKDDQEMITRQAKQAAPGR
jgi:hypothetical protein